MMQARISLSLLALHVAFCGGQRCLAQSSPKPVVQWNFDDGKTIGTWHGKPKVAVATLVPPRYPGFDAKNQSAYFKPGLYLRVKDAQLAGDKLRFNLGDTITLEAWVKQSIVANGRHVYIIGKGRTGNPGFAPDNQNYALRLTGKSNGARLSFLFRSKREKNRASEYHRWTSKNGFISGTGWHHVVLTYTFGKSKSLKAYIDGERVSGTWDLGGATDRAPVSDADDILIGASHDGTGNPLRGWLDDVAIYRTPIEEKIIAKRAERKSVTPTMTAKRLPENKVLVEVYEEGIPPTGGWPDQLLTPNDAYHVDAFGFAQVPNKYVDTGVRGERPNPYMIRAGASVTIPAGKHRLLLRGRGSCRLWIDGKAIMQIQSRRSLTGGHTAIPTNYLDLGPDFRFAPPGNRETWKYFESPGKKHRIMLESIIGGKRGGGHLRLELGETVVAN